MKSPDLFQNGTVLLYISKNARQQRELVELLSDRFSFISSNTAAGGLLVLEEFGKKLAAVLIDLKPSPIRSRCPPLPSLWSAMSSRATGAAPVCL